MLQAHEVHGRTPNGDVRQSVAQRQEKGSTDQEGDVENGRGQHEASQPDFIIDNMAPSGAMLSLYHCHHARCSCHALSCQRAVCSPLRRVLHALFCSGTTSTRDKLDTSPGIQFRCAINVLGEGTDMQQRALFYVFAVLLCWAAVAPAAAELTPQQIAVVVNVSSRDSVQVGHHYATQRGVSEAQ